MILALVHESSEVRSAGHLAANRLVGDTGPMSSRVHPTFKTRYRVTNWPAYDRGLVQRGDVTVWLSSEAIGAWCGQPTGRRDRLRARTSEAQVVEARLACEILPQMAALGRPSSGALKT